MTTFVRIGNKGDVTSAVYAMEGDSYWRFPWAQRKDGQTPDFATPTWVKPVGNGWNSVDTSKLVPLDTAATEEQAKALAYALTEEGKKATLAALKGGAAPKPADPLYANPPEYGDEAEAAVEEATEVILNAAELTQESAAHMMKTAAKNGK